ncbi:MULTISPECIES: hypothetical protein [Thermoleptolyngbya]|nr:MULTISPECIES: hypothetical protein [Thermoleptolyngbya]
MDVCTGCDRPRQLSCASSSNAQYGGSVWRLSWYWASGAGRDV